MKQINALAGQGFAQPKNSLKESSDPTMSSLQMVDYINADRKSKAEVEGFSFPCKECRKLEHRNFMRKVPKVLGDACAKFFAPDTYIDGNRKENVNLYGLNIRRHMPPRTKYH